MEIIDAPITSAIGVYNPIAAGIALMLQKHGAILTAPIVVNGDADKMAAAKEGRKELKKFRTSLEAKRKEEKAESLAYGRLVDSEAARIQAFATPLELSYDKSVTDEETRVDLIREAELQAEQKRIDGHRMRIQGIKGVCETAVMCRTSERLQSLIDGMPSRIIDGFEEFQAEAETEYSKTCSILSEMLAAKVEAEAQALELKRQQDELTRQRAEQARRDLADRQARADEEAEFAKRKADFEARQQQARAVQEAQAAALAAPVIGVAQVIEAPKPVSVPAPVPVKTEALPEAVTPSAQQLIQAIAEMFGVSVREARGWLIERAEEIQSV